MGRGFRRDGCPVGPGPMVTQSNRMDPGRVPFRHQLEQERQPLYDPIDRNRAGGGDIGPDGDVAAAQVHEHAAGHTGSAPIQRYDELRGYRSR
jgi:hypothetical protein